MRPSRPQRNPWGALLVLCLANFLILLDTTIVNTALPSIMTSIDTSLDGALWVLNAYLLAFASLLLVFSRLGDMLGPRRLFIAGLIGFICASALCGLAQNSAELICARVVQGAAAAMLVPQALVLITAAFPPTRRGAAFGVFTALAGVAAISGPSIGGLLVTDSGWRWVFWLNVPIGALGVLLTRRLVPDLRVNRTHRLDTIGVALSTGGLGLLVYGLVEGSRMAIAPHYALIAAGLVSLALFRTWERRQPEPLIPPELLRTGDFRIAALLTLASNFALYGFLLVFVLETQVGLGMSPLRSGLCALSLTVTLSAFAPLAGRAADRFGGRSLLCLGLAVNAAGVALTAALPDVDSTWQTFVLPLTAVGAGMGLAIAPTTTIAMRDVPPQLAAPASGVLNTARQVGAVFGAAIVGSLYQSRITAALTAAARAEAPKLPSAERAPFAAALAHAAASVSTGQASPANASSSAQAELVAQALRHSLFDASRPALAVVAGVLALGSVTAFAIRRPTQAAAPEDSDLRTLSTRR